MMNKNLIEALTAEPRYPVRGLPDIAYYALEDMQRTLFLVAVGFKTERPLFR